MYSNRMCELPMAMCLEHRPETLNINFYTISLSMSMMFVIVWSLTSVPLTIRVSLHSIHLQITCKILNKTTSAIYTKRMISAIRNHVDGCISQQLCMNWLIVDCMCSFIWWSSESVIHSQFLHGSCELVMSRMTVCDATTIGGGITPCGVCG